MNIFQAYLCGFKTIPRSLKMISFIYCIVFILAVLVALPFLTSLKSAAGPSIATEQLTTDFNYTVIQELFLAKDFSFPIHLNQAIWILFLYTVLSIFLTGGILSNLKNAGDSFRIKSFLYNSAHYFIRFLKLTFYTLLIHLFFAIIIYLPFYFIVNGEAGSTATEKWFFQLFIVFLGIHIILAIFLIIVTDYTRFRMVKDDTPKVLKSLWSAIRFVVKRFFCTYGLYLFLLVLPLLLFYGMVVIYPNIIARTGWVILLVFILQQIFICLRIAFRIWTFSSQFEYYLKQSVQVQRPV